MRVTLQQADVLRELAFLKIALREDTDPLTFRTETDAVVMTASSSLCHMQTRVPAGVVRAGEGRVFGPPLRRLLDGLGSIQFSLDISPGASRAELVAGPFSASLTRPSKNGFVDPRATREYTHSLDIDAGVLSALISLASTAFPDVTQGMGILFEANKDRTRIVSTDGHRLNVATGPGLDSDTRLIFATPMLDQILAMLKGYAGTVVINHNEKSIIEVLAGDRLVRGSLMNKVFPDFQRIIPNVKSRVSVKREALIRVVRRTSILGNKDVPSVILTFDGSADLKCESRHTIEDRRGRKHEESAADVVPIKESSGEPFTTRVKSAYILDSLETIQTDVVELLSESSKHPLMITPVTGDRNVNVIIMPMSLVEPVKAAA